MATFRIGLTLDAEQNRRFIALAEFEQKKPATLAAEIVKAYMESRSADIDSILRAKDDYEKSVEKLRQKNSQ